jgi:hypothetical protein
LAKAGFNLDILSPLHTLGEKSPESPNVNRFP